MAVTGICQVTHVWHNLARGESISMGGYKVDIPKESYFSRHRPDDDLQESLAVGDYAYYEGEFHHDTWDKIVAAKARMSTDYQRNILGRIKSVDPAYGTAMAYQPRAVMFFPKSALRIRFYPPLNMDQVFLPNDEVFMDAAMTRRANPSRSTYVVTEIRLPKMTRKLPDENTMICQAILVAAHKSAVAQFFSQGLGFISYTFANPDMKYASPGSRFWLRLSRSSRTASWNVGECKLDATFRLSVAGPGVGPFDLNARSVISPLAIIPEVPDLLHKGNDDTEHLSLDHELDNLLSVASSGSKVEQTLGEKSRTLPLGFANRKEVSSPPYAMFSGITKSASQSFVPTPSSAISTHRNWRSMSVETELANTLAITEGWTQARVQPAKHSQPVVTANPHSLGKEYKWAFTAPKLRNTEHPSGRITNDKQRPQSADFSGSQQFDYSFPYIDSFNVSSTTPGATFDPITQTTRRTKGSSISGYPLSAFERVSTVNPTGLSRTNCPQPKPKDWYSTTSPAASTFPHRRPTHIKEQNLVRIGNSSRYIDIKAGPVETGCQTEQHTDVKAILGQLLSDDEIFSLICRRHPKLVKQLADYKLVI